MKCHSDSNIANRNIIQYDNQTNYVQFLQISKYSMLTYMFFEGIEKFTSKLFSYCRTPNVINCLIIYLDPGVID